MAAQNLFGLTTTTRSILHSKCRLQNPVSQNSIFGLTTPQTFGNSWLGSNKLHSADLPPITPKLRPTASTIAFSLPTTTKPDRVSSEEKMPNCLEKYKSRWSSRAIKAYAMSELEARKIRKPNTGTEALLMGILIEGTNVAAKFLRANGITLEKVREETFNLVGKPNKYFFSPEHPPLTEAAQRVIDRAFDEKIKSVFDKTSSSEQEAATAGDAIAGACSSGCIICPRSSSVLGLARRPGSSAEIIRRISKLLPRIF